MSTIDRCARAIAEVRARYDIMLGYKCRVIDKGNPNWPKVFSGDEEECQHWIDRQAAIACIEALLPDFCEGKSGDIAEDDYDRRADDYELAHCNRGLLNGAFAAAIRSITSEGRGEMENDFISPEELARMKQAEIDHPATEHTNDGGWCKRCGCGNDVLGYKHLAACPTRSAAP